MSTLERTPVQTRGTKPFMPDLVFFEPDALNYPKGQRIMDWVKAKDIPYRMTTSHNRITNLPGETEVEKYRMAKKTLVVGIRKTLTFDQSKPSAEYAIPISTGCMGHCHYCYLQTTLGAKPYIRIYVNTDDIISAAKGYIEERVPEITRFEAACTSDPVGLEHITGSLGDLIRFMADEEFGRLRFVTKYHHVDPLLDIKHNGHTRIRFSINSDYVIKQFEPATSRFEERIEAAGKIARAGYPLGFIIAPIIWYDGWEAGYGELLRRLGETLPQHATKDLTFELIQHRFTKTSKAVIEKRYPKTKLEMDIEKRKKKWGRWGQNKYVYPDEQQNALREFITERIFEHFPLSRIEYFT
ncbi:MULTISPECIES: spore photoproduct lyase [Paenibacillus]|uniref:spore photoproduct lyase n=1 Tax=Paenibacillus TaxID=44249 RepID=UPI000737B036|nr:MULTISPECIES: spore photoproduct lyase [Paenibacillus]KAF6568574.1 spore photoproduct lyase [Paenibacillus sp. EKM202P]KAF6570419.1 spore photoproduct lyase [Paenibacillus sp. EKM207P]MBU9706883.1 spore photoproduct lyase [Paenibacillus sp. AK121]MEE4567169.1 spore photoproduct lyase [Paenibacillus polymyxa]OAZ48438.1 spore photoproduct lyase [Paenibacillus polymyxa]